MTPIKSWLEKMTEKHKRTAFYSMAAIVSLGLFAWLLHTHLVFVPVQAPGNRSCEVHGGKFSKCIAHNDRRLVLEFPPPSDQFFAARQNQFPHVRRPLTGRRTHAPRRYPLTYRYYCQECDTAKKRWLAVNKRNSQPIGAP
jgi:hypothetical protein